MERRGRVPIGGKLSRGVVSESLHPTSFPSPPPPAPSTFVPFSPGRRSGAGTSRGRPDWSPGAMRLLPLLRTVLWAALLGSRLRGCSSLRHPVYWNSTNPR